MPLPARLFGPDREEIIDLDSWLVHAPPEKGEAQWRDGYSAKEQAKSWLKSGKPAMPDEVVAALADYVEADEVNGRPEHRTKLDRFGHDRQHDLFACLRQGGETGLVAGIEAKACEPFGGLVSERASAEAPSNRRARCNLLSQALFGKPVFDEKIGTILDEDLASHGYQLWTAAVGTIIEAQARNVSECCLVVHQFRPADLEAAKDADDKRDWTAALDSNGAAFATFAAAIESAGSVSYGTPFVTPGTKLHVVKAESSIDG